jgi:hypothetical protein
MIPYFHSMVENKTKILFGFGRSNAGNIIAKKRICQTMMYRTRAAQDCFHSGFIFFCRGNRLDLWKE